MYANQTFKPQNNHKIEAFVAHVDHNHYYPYTACIIITTIDYHNIIVRDSNSKS